MIIRNDCLYGSNDLDKIVDSFASNNRAKPKRLSEPGDWCSVIDERTTNSFAWWSFSGDARPNGPDPESGEVTSYRFS